MKPHRLAWVLTIVGGVLVVAGVATVSITLAIIAAGFLLATVGLVFVQVQP